MLIYVSREYLITNFLLSCFTSVFLILVSLCLESLGNATTTSGSASNAALGSVEAQLAKIQSGKYCNQQ